MADPAIGGGEPAAGADHQPGADAAAGHRDAIQGEVGAALEPHAGLVLHVGLDQDIVVLAAADHRDIAQVKSPGPLDVEGPVAVEPVQLADRAVGQAREGGAAAQPARDREGPAAAIHRPAAGQGALERSGVVGRAVPPRPQRPGVERRFRRRLLPGQAGNERAREDAHE